MAQGWSLYASGKAKNTFDPVDIPLLGVPQAPGNKPTPQKGVKAWGDGPLRPEELSSAKAHPAEPPRDKTAYRMQPNNWRGKIRGPLLCSNMLVHSLWAASEFEACQLSSFVFVEFFIQTSSLLAVDSRKITRWSLHSLVVTEEGTSTFFAPHMRTRFRNSSFPWSFSTITSASGLLFSDYCLLYLFICLFIHWISYELFNYVRLCLVTWPREDDPFVCQSLGKVHTSYFRGRILVCTYTIWKNGQNSVFCTIPSL